MIVLKGDIVRTHDGLTGEVIDVWGKARSFIKLKCASSGMSIPMFESEVSEIVERSSKKGGKEREKRKVPNSQTEAGNGMRQAVAF
ncbi:hypothetical protein PAECIP111893_00295 [Paenibacillus plantiphilus]|uniref:DUF2187 domain-containing protein n=1 Tax=Paenibacillus plantiphilus TaxID=2905650 RepID=A0ABM9BMN9_9BACL|nr:hypothetical protein [Paenibacillus plantiphilus]CAH1190364.1 hypothetical protein PAECIP111893_00295 [Paenibacillus plantiphilus]